MEIWLDTALVSIPVIEDPTIDAKHDESHCHFF